MCQLEHRVKRRLGRAAAVAALLAAVGCGTTVPLAGSQPGSGGGPGSGGSSGSGGSLGSGGLGSGAGLVAPAGGQSGPPGRSGLAPTGVGQPVGAAGPAAAPTTAAGSLPPENGPGVAATSLTIGVAYFQNANQANQAIGGHGVDVADPTVVDRIITGDVNQHGGVAGRRVQVLYYPVDPQSSQPYATEAQAMCSYFTQDHKVFLVIDGTQAVGYLARPCLQAHDVGYLTDNTVVVSDLGKDEFDPDALRWSRVLAALVPALIRQDWFAAWNRTTGAAGVARAKVGLVTADRPALQTAVNEILIPALRSAGYSPSPADVIRIAEPGGFTDDGATVAAIDNAVLKLNSDGVDHVILTDSNGSLSLLFNNYAYSQHYLPRYGGDTGNFWQSLLSAGDIQAATLHGAEGVGWIPIIDLPYHSGSDGPFPNATRAHCFALMRSAGQPPTDASVAASELVACDAFDFLQVVLRLVRQPLNLTVLTEKVDVSGAAFQPALALVDDFSAGQHDGPSASYDLAFSTGCGCFGYSGPRRVLPGYSG